MALQLSVAVRNARLDAIEATVGATAVMKLRSGAQPATCATADSGTVIATLTLPADWMAAAGSGAKALLGTWQDLSADNSGRIGHSRACRRAPGRQADRSAQLPCSECLFNFSW